VALFKKVLYNMLVEDMTSAALNPTPTGNRNSLTNGDNWNPKDSRIAFMINPTSTEKSSNKKKKRKKAVKKKIIPFKRPPIQGTVTGVNYSGIGA
jgi:hypothetical protein